MSRMSRRYWREMTTEEFSSLDPERTIAVLPVAAIEQHGPHLPVCVDACINEGILSRAVGLLPDDLPVTVLPMVSVGKSSEHAAYPGTLTLSTETLLRVLMEIGEKMLQDPAPAGLEEASAIFQNKIAVSEAYLESGIEGYSSETLPDLLANVTADAASVEEAQAAIDEIKPGVPGDNLSLTTDVDDLTGTAIDDTFTAALNQTVNADGTQTLLQTLTAADIVDGGEGTDRLNARLIDNSADNVVVNNVEELYLRSTDNAANLNMTGVSGAEQVWNDRSSADLTVTNVQNSVAVGLNSVAANTTYAVQYATNALGSTAAEQTIVTQGAGSATAATNVNLTLAGAGDVITTLNVAATGSNNIDLSGGAALNTVTSLNVTGEGSLNLNTLNTGLETVAAGENTGGLTFTAGDGDLQEVTTGAGDDSITLAGNLADEGFVTTGAGDDTVNAGGFNVAAGASINLGAGDDVVTNLGTVDKDASIDGGEGIDTLQLQAVAAANVGAFSNFEVFDVAALNKTLDMDILASQNDVNEVVGSAALGGASTLTNVGAGVNFRATADMGATELTLTQKTAGEFTVTLDADQASTASATTNNNATTTVDLTNATSVNAVFDSASVNEIAGAITNTQTITLETDNAESISIVSGGENAANVLALTDTSDSNGTAAGGDSLLTEIVITGDQDLDLTGITINNTNKLASVDAGALTGDLTVELADLANGAVVTLGSGADTVVVAANAGSATGDIESIVGFEASESTTDADLIAEADVIDFVSNVAVSTAAATGDAQIADGVIEFLGAGPSTLDQAIGFADALVGTDNEAAIFEYVGNSFVFIQDSVNGDSVVELTGVTGVDSLNANADANLYIA